MKKNCAGFTLIEILIALVILAIIGGMMVVGLQSAIRSQNRITVRSDRLSVVQSAIAVLERDIQQIINRPIIDGNRALPSIMLVSRDDKQVLEFTRAGLINPFAIQNRTTMQRVSYYLDGKNLLRITWPVLDRTPNSSSQTELILPNVSGFKVTLYYALAQSNNQPTSFAGQPPQIITRDATPNVQEQTSLTTIKAMPLPVAVEVMLQVDEIGIVTRFIPLAG